MWVEDEEGNPVTEVFFHIDNEPAIYITQKGGGDDLVYVECDELYEWDRFDSINSQEIMQNKKELENRLQEFVGEPRHD